MDDEEEKFLLVGRVKSQAPVRTVEEWRSEILLRYEQGLSLKPKTARPPGPWADRCHKTYWPRCSECRWVRRHRPHCKLAGKLVLAPRPVGSAPMRNEHLPWEHMRRLQLRKATAARPKSKHRDELVAAEDSGRFAKRGPDDPETP